MLKISQNKLLEYKEIFEQLDKDFYGRVALKSFDIISWLKSHLSGQSFAVITSLKNQILKTP